MTTSTVAGTRTDAPPIDRPEPSRPRSRPSNEYWDVWQARWTSADATGLVPAPRRGD